MIHSLHLPQTVLVALKPYWRWRWTFLLSAWLFCLLGWTVVALLPERYESMTRIYADTETLLTPLLHNIAVQADFQKQLQVMQRTLINRNNLAQVARAIDLDLDLKTDLDKERLYTNLSSRVSIRVEGLNLFQVGFRDSDPKRAKKAVETLLAIFIETNLGQNRSSMDNARNFLDAQIQDYEQKMRLSEQRLASFKSENYEALPAASGASFGVRHEDLRREQMLARSRRDNAVVARDLIRATLATTPQTIAVASPPQVVVNANGSAGSPRQRVAQLRQDLVNLRSRFTEQHLDVITTQRALELAEAQLAEESREKGSGAADREGGNNTASNPVYEQIKMRLVQADGEVAQAQSQLTITTAEFERMQSMANVAPRLEADLADLNREYGVIRTKYEEMLNRRESARISQAVETSGDKIQFRVIEPPQEPVRPVFPNRPLFVTLVFLAALGGGCGVVLIARSLDDTILSASGLAEEFHVRFLGSVSQVETVAILAANRRSNRRFALGTGGLVVTFLLVLLSSQMYQVNDFLAKTAFPSFFERVRSYVG